MFTEYQNYDALGLAELIRRKEVSPQEVMEAAIQRYEEINPKINAVTRPMFELIEESLKKADKNSLFYGVPFLLKDLSVQYAGVPTTSGSVFFKDYIPNADSDLVVRYKKAGLIIIGKTNTPEFGANWVTESRLLGACRNPYNFSKTAGGSSGGSAAAVAAGIVPAAHASDGGGSIRIPASCCGLIGLKPTRGRVSIDAHKSSGIAVLSTHHAITKTVRDCAALLDVTKNDVSGESYLETLDHSLENLKIGLIVEAPGGYDIHPECRLAVTKAVTLCEALGHSIEITQLPVDLAKLGEATTVIWSKEILSGLDERARQLGRPYTEDDVEPATLWMARLARQFNLIDYKGALATIQSIAQQVIQHTDQYDVLLMPTLGEPPVDIGYLFYEESKGPINDFYRKGFAFCPFTAIFNVTGQPAMSLPLHNTPEGLPIGVQFVGRLGEEGTLLRLARSLLAK